MITSKYKRGQNPKSRRKPSGEKTVTVSFRIREEWREPIKEVVRKEISKLKKNEK
jgi:hypothetical protein